MMRVVACLIAAAAIFSLSCSRGKDGPEATPTIGVDTSARDIVTKALAAWEQSVSGHVILETTVTAQGSVLRVNQDLLFNETTFYTESTSFGVKTLLLQQNGAACVKEPGKEWRRERLLDKQPSPKSGGGILKDLDRLSYRQLERLPDSTTPDGRPALVVKGTLNEYDLAPIAAAVGQTAGGLKVTVNSMSMEVKIEKETLRVREIKFDIEYGLPDSTFTATSVMRIDRVNEPVSFPPDIPEVCSDGAA